jgi:hypothetical protein
MQIRRISISLALGSTGLPCERFLTATPCSWPRLPLI